MKGYLVLRPLNEIILKNLFSEQGHLLTSCKIEREKFYPGLGLELNEVVITLNILSLTVIQGFVNACFHRT